MDLGTLRGIRHRKRLPVEVKEQRQMQELVKDQENQLEDKNG